MNMLTLILNHDAELLTLRTNETVHPNKMPESANQLDRQMPFLYYSLSPRNLGA